MQIPTQLIEAPVSIPCEEPNLLYTKSVSAGWTARVLTSKPQLSRPVLEWLFWLVNDTFGDRSAVLDLLLTKADQERLLPELKKNWDNPDDLAGVVGAVLGRVQVGRQRKVSLELAGLLSRWGHQQGSGSDSPLARNLEKTRCLFGLSQNEVSFGFFFGAMQWWEPIKNFFDRNLECDQPVGRHVLMKALGFTPHDLSEVLSGKLFKIGIMDADSPYLSLESDYMAYFTDPYLAPVSQDLFRQTAAPALSMEGLGMDREEIGYLKALFRSSQASPLHVLVYGQPGTGKTTLCKSLIAELGLKGFEVLGASGRNCSSRRAALAACLEMVSDQEGSCLVVDEADSLLSTLSGWHQRGEVLEKVWLNELLEKRGLRCIWIVNSHDGIDPAVLRRFTYSLEMNPLGWKMRGVMLEGILRRNGIKRHFPTNDIQTLARDFNLAPAVFETAATAAARVQGGGSGQCRKAFRRALDAKARLFKVPVGNTTDKSSLGFMREAVNPDMELDTLEARVKAFDGERQSGARSRGLGLMFFGPPGTGKTFTARHLADVIDRPVMSFKASDWLDPYVGVTEQNIAAAFQKAAAEEAVMIVDEIDTFLQARSGRGQRWETSLVNELLVQIESFTGILICTTNRMDNIDAAAIRRFPLKVGFNYLKSSQVLDLYKQILAPLAVGVLSDRGARTLSGLGAVTAADLFLVKRNVQVLGGKRPSHGQLIADVAREVDLKKEPVAGQVIGF